MKKLFALALVVGVALTAAPVYAQSSGNFSARVATPACEVNNLTGALSGGLTGTLLSTTIKTPNSGSTALLIRPSLVTGLFTRTRVDDTVSTATAVAGVRVRVLLDGNPVAPGTVAGGGWVAFDKRFQQLSTNIFNILDDDCDPVAEGVQPCNIELVLSTLSAHSFDFVAGDVGGGLHSLQVEWQLQPTTGNANEAACVGPGVLTVQQVKTFSTGGGIVID